MAELFRMSAAETAEAIRSGAVSAAEVTDAHLARIEQVEPQVRAFLHVAPDQARPKPPGWSTAAAAGEARPRPLAGVPLALKDVFTTNDMPTTCGSRNSGRLAPALRRDVHRRLREAGILILGKTNMDEFAMGVSTENSAFGPTLNPWNVERVPGGSGAACRGAGRVPGTACLGSDTGGSIRQPAALTATVGVKPTYGRCRGTGWWRAPRRSIRAARARARCSTLRCCTR